MDKKAETLRAITDSGVIAVIRMNSSALLRKVAEAIGAGGVRVIEFTMTTPGALHVLEEMAGDAGSSIFGAGTVLDAETARAAILAGARFVVGPTVNEGVIRVCRRYDIPVIPGAFTPTEILSAWELGADLVKLFPAAVVGPQYVKDILGPLPYLKLVPTGGIDVGNAGAFIQAGAVAVGVGSSLVDKKVVSEGRFDALTELARRFIAVVASARAARQAI